MIESRILRKMSFKKEKKDTLYLKILSHQISENGIFLFCHK